MAVYEAEVGRPRLQPSGLTTAGEDVHLRVCVHVSSWYVTHVAAF